MPCARRDISPTSEVRMEVQRITGPRFLPKLRQANEVIDLQAISNEYWDSTEHEVIVQS